MSSKILGTKGAIEQGREYSGGPNKPNIITRTWKGIKSSILPLIGQAQLAGYDWSAKEEGPNATIQMTTPILPEGGGTETPVEIWELMPGKVEKDILESDTDLINNLSSDQKAAIRAALQDPSNDSLVTNITDQTAIDLYVMMLHGLKSKIVFAPVLSRTQIVSNAYQVKASTHNVQRIISNATLIGSGPDAELLPTGFIIQLSGFPYDSASPVQLEGMNSLLHYGWYKHPPHSRTASYSTIQIQQEWEFGLWPELIYDVPL